MRIAGQANLAAAREDIWPLIFDPAALLELLPGCSEVRQSAPDEYTARLVLRVPAIAGEYLTRVRVEETDPGRYCRFSGAANGPSGSVSGTASFTLASEGDATRIEYQGDAVIGGPLAGMNPRFAEGVAKTLICQGISRLPALAAARAAEKADVAGAPGDLADISTHFALRRVFARLRSWLARLFGSKYLRGVPGNRA